jgi:UDP-N-acetylglucosamine/UDP-N-acetylgalactosamine diphosphorylase
MMHMDDRSSNKVKELLDKGVKIPNPAAVEIGDEVKPENISGHRTTLHAGCKIFGKDTLILDDVALGYEGPVTVDNCQIGPQVQLKGGFFKEAVFLKKSSAGSGAHVREGTIFEEEASIAHTVGLKQTILFPFVTLGSLINFCDCFMAGGTSRRNHSEVGSSYIHFNFTPNQDKVTPSLMGDVPQGVMLDQPPIFLGGQGGLVGPCRLAFGTVIAAGTIYRKDELRSSRLIFEGSGRGGNLPFAPGVYRGFKRIIVNNIIYISNLIALNQWYGHVRKLFISNAFPGALLEALAEKLAMGIDERIQRLEALANQLTETIAIRQEKPSGKKAAPSRTLMQQKEFCAAMPRITSIFENMRQYDGDLRLLNAFREQLTHSMNLHNKDYISTIKTLDSIAKNNGTKWLQDIVDTVISKVLNAMPSFQ